VNRKRVYRLWRREGLKVPQKARKKRHLGHSANGCVRRRAEHADHVWAWDFIFDRTTTGQSLKWLSIVDEYTRECLALVVARSITAQDVLDVVAELFVVRGVAGYLRSDNGPEFIARALRRWLEWTNAKTLYIAPGAPWENGYAESFHSRLRDELLNVEEFANVAEARVLAERWQLEYNHRRPHSALGYQTPAEFAAACRRDGTFLPARFSVIAGWRRFFSIIPWAATTCAPARSATVKVMCTLRTPATIAPGCRRRCSRAT
jgi:putative transposase